MIHIYCGEGKGKTTAAMGLALRMAGRDRDVLIAQFLKSSNSGERAALAQLPHVTLIPLPDQHKFLWNMTPEELEQERSRSAALLDQVCDELRSNDYGLVVLDELCGALTHQLVSLTAVQDCLALCCSRDTEAVLTGRNPHSALLDQADYVTQMDNIRHPYQKGICSRLGVEF